MYIHFYYYKYSRTNVPRGTFVHTLLRYRTTSLVKGNT